MKMRVLSVMVSLCMVSAMMPNSVAADDAAGEITVTTADAFKAALADETITTITLGAGLEFDQGEIAIRDGVTINGQGHTITFHNVIHYSQNAAFYSAGSYTVQNLTITLADSATNTTAGAIKMSNGGTVTDVVINGKFIYGVFVNNAAVTVSGCTFDNDNGTSGTYGVYSDTSVTGEITIENNIFNSPRAAILYNGGTFTGNEVNSPKGVSVATSTAEITGNTFNGDRALSISAPISISGNNFAENTRVEASADVDLTGNYWGGGAPQENQLVKEGNISITVDSSSKVAFDENGDAPFVPEEDESTSFNILVALLLKRFMTEYDVEIEVIGDGAVVTDDADNKVRFSKDVTLSFIPDDGAELLSVTINGETVEVVDGNYIINNIKKDAKVVAAFSVVEDAE